MKNPNALFWLETGLFFASLVVRPPAPRRRRLGKAIPSSWDGSQTTEERRYGILPGDGAKAEAMAHEWSSLAEQVATSVATTPLLLALCHVGAYGNPKAVSSHGAQGLLQLTPEVATRLQVDPFDPAQAFKGGVLWYTALEERYHKELATILFAWMRGTAEADKAQQRKKVGSKLQALASYVHALAALYEEILR